jgi:hypothetical protein
VHTGMHEDPLQSEYGAARDVLSCYYGRLSLATLQLALRTTTERLASELNRPTAVAPDWSGFEWAVARAVASIHGVSPLLAGALRWRGPDQWMQFLAQQKIHTATRFGRIQHLLQLIDRRARESEIALVALKGVALHACGLYEAGERPMADVDLLVRENEAQRAEQLLTELGFHATSRTSRETEFEQQSASVPVALGEHSSNSIKIELHSHIRELLPLRAVDISEIVFPARLHPGLNSYASKATLLIHLLLHAAGALAARSLRLLQLHDIARLVRNLSHQDWEQVSRECAQALEGRDQSMWWAFPPLTLTARYFGGVPEEILERAASHCHWLLRRVYRHKSLSSSSLSYLWISAFPGIEWARAPQEMLEYAKTRILPSMETVRLRTTLASVQPRVSGGSWAELSQIQRVLRWMSSRAPRYETLQPVYAALRASH